MSNFRLSLWLLLYSCTVASSQPLPSLDAAEIRLGLRRLNVLGSVLMIAAHPDDENTSVLTYLEKGLGIRTAYLSVTRGEGGQNLIGTEQGDLLGLIRTQELLAARRIDGAEQFFTNAIDFGYSKSPEEALRIWQKDSVLADVVWVIRKFRPDVILTRFTPTYGTHGHHTASAILAREAFEAAGDPRRFPDQLTHVQPWKAKRLLFNPSRAYNQPYDTAQTSQLDVGQFSPILGKSYTEISGLSRSMHKSQGFGAMQNRGRNVNYFLHVAGDSATNDFFQGITTDWSRIPGSAHIQKLIAHAQKAFDPDAPAATVTHLVKAFDAMNKLKSQDPWVALKKAETAELIRACAGIWIEAIASEYAYSPGDSVRISASALNRSSLNFTLEKIITSQRETTLSVGLPNNVAFSTPLGIKLPASAKLTQPYWLETPSAPGRYRLSNSLNVGTAENEPALPVIFLLEIDGIQIPLSVPAQFRWVDPVEGEMYRPLEVTPRLSVNFEKPTYLFASEKPQKVVTIIRAGTAQVSGNLRLRLPDGWRADPEAVSFSLQKKSDQQAVTFTVTPGSGTGGAMIAETDEGTARGMVTIRYAHIPPQTVFPAAQSRLVRLDIHRARNNLGYIMGSGDAIPDALKQLGYNVQLIDDDELASGNLSAYDAVIAGVRAYNTRPQLRVHQQRLMAYVRAGGTYLVQYATQQRGESEAMGPYRLGISRERVTFEDAPISFLKPDHPILQTPNQIRKEDFDGWVQERGLYFADQWDSSHYVAPLACNDPGETPKPGGLLISEYGNGVFIYTGYSFFRQIPIGNSGALRLFVNLIEARSPNDRSRM